MSKFTNGEDKSAFDEALESEMPLVAVFFAEWSVVWKRKKMSEKVDALMGIYHDRVKFLKIDVEKEVELAKRFVAQTQVLPTIVGFQKGRELWRIDGFATLEELEDCIKSFFQTAS